MKKYIRFLGLGILLFIVPMVSQAQQSLLQNANEYYDYLAFSDAIPLYQRVLKSDSMNPEALIKLADCYRLTNNNPKAMETYAKVITLKEKQPIHEFLYAQTLMVAGKYAEAKEHMKAYTADPRGEIFAKSIDQIDNFNKNKNNYTVTKALFNSPKNDFSPAFFKDNSIVFTSSRDRTQLVSYKSAWTGNNYDALYIVKKRVNGKYTNPTLLDEGGLSQLNDGTAFFSADGKHVYFTKNNEDESGEVRDVNGKLKLKIYQATLGRGNSFNDIKEFKYNNKDYNCAHPTVNDNETAIYFSSDMPGGFGGMDIWVSFKKDSIWTAPVNLGDKVNTLGNEVFPYLFKNNRLYFSSNGLNGMGGLDIYSVELDGNGLPKESPQNVGAPINSNFDDFGMILYPSADSGYFSSNVGRANNDDDIYFFALKKPIEEIKIIGTVTDSKTNEIISDAKVTLKDNTGKVIGELTSDKEGKFSFKADYNKDYVLTSQKEKYTDGAPKAVSTKVSTTVKEIIANIVLEKKVEEVVVVEEKFNTKLNIKVTNVKDDSPLEGVKIDFLDKTNGKTVSFTTDVNGKYSVGLGELKVGDKLSYRLTMSKDRFVTKSVDWDFTVSKAGDIDLLESIGKVEVGNDIEELISIKPIYFDYNKFDIRPDAAIELDKVVRFLNKYPTVFIELGSHTDCRGSAKANQILSENRAKATNDYLVSKGIPQERITDAIGYGETKLINKCECEGTRIVPCTEEEHAMNRRTEFVIDSLGKSKPKVVTPKKETPVETPSDTRPAIDPNAEYHVVELGDTLFNIAKRANTTVEKLRALNNLTDNNIIVGRKLKIR